MTMTLRTGIHLGIVTLAVLAGVWTWRQSVGRREARAAVAELDAQKRAAQTEAAAFAARAGAADAIRAKHAAEFAELKKTTDAAQASVAKAPAPTPPRRPWIPERLQTEPEFQLLWLADRRAALTTTYGPLARQLRLSPEQVERMQAALIKREEQRMDIQATQRAQGLADSDPAVRQPLEKVDREYQQAQKDVLGEAGYARLKDYERSVYARELLAGIAGGAAVVAREPFTPQQAEQLFSAMVNASPNHRRGGGFLPYEVDWSKVDEEAAKFLSPSQLAFFQTAEPPLPYGGRFQSQLYRTVEAAKKSEPPPGKTTTGG